jgi:hypothetical protein
MFKLITALLLLSACVSEQAIRGELYMNDGLPADICARYPEIRVYGAYRVVKCPNKKIRGCEQGQPDYEEVLPYCSQRIRTFLSADRIQVEAWIKQATRPR